MANTVAVVNLTDSPLTIAATGQVAQPGVPVEVPAEVANGAPGPDAQHPGYAGLLEQSATWAKDKLAAARDAAPDAPAIPVVEAIPAPPNGDPIVPTPSA